MKSDDPDVYLDGFEIYNKGVEDIPKRKKGYRDTNPDAQRFFSENKEFSACVGSSDGHRMTVGRGLTALEEFRKKFLVVKFLNT